MKLTSTPLIIVSGGHNTPPSGGKDLARRAKHLRLTLDVTAKEAPDRCGTPLISLPAPRGPRCKATVLEQVLPSFLGVLSSEDRVINALREKDATQGDGDLKGEEPTDQKTEDAKTETILLPDRRSAAVFAVNTAEPWRSMTCCGQKPE
uniref:Uncharacterized protein n=1 Tax=Steinernema glaseri TaxID=37863 RepID=A0A1I8AU20_9BILA